MKKKRKHTHFKKNKKKAKKNNFQNESLQKEANVEKKEFENTQVLFKKNFFQIFKEKIKLNIKNVFYNPKNIIFYVLTLAMVSFMLCKTIFFSAKKDFISLLQVENFYKDLQNDKNKIKEIKNLLKNKNFLFPIYYSKIGQKLLFENNDIDFFSLENKILKNSNWYKDFSNISILISKNEWQKALDLSYLLQEKIRDKKDLKTLLLFNLYRIAFLEKKLKNREREKEILKSIKGFENIEIIFKNQEFFKNYLLNTF